jgi:hypothetical protein
VVGRKESSDMNRRIVMGPSCRPASVPGGPARIGVATNHRPEA